MAKPASDFSQLVAASTSSRLKAGPSFPGAQPISIGPEYRWWYVPVAVVILLLLCGFLFFYRLSERDLWSSHEGRAAQNAQSILDEGCWGLPRQFDRHLELQKPPLYYWLVAVTAQLCGQRVDALMVRLPAALAGTGCVLLLFGFCWWRGRAVAGLIAAAILATSMHYTWIARIGRIDVPLTFVISLALGAFYFGWQRVREPGGRSGWPCFLVGYLALASGLLLKGPIAVILPAGVVFVHLLLERELPRLRQCKRWLRLGHELGLWWGVAVIIAVAGPWYIWAGIKTDGSMVSTFLWYHNIARAFGGSRLRAHPWWFYVPRLSMDLLPWSLCLPWACWYFWRSRASTKPRTPAEVGKNAWREDSEARFGLRWLITILVLLSCLRFKRADYLLPAYPGAALFLGCAAERWYRTGIRCKYLVTGSLMIIVAYAAGWWGYVGFTLPAQELAREQTRFARAIRRLVPTPNLVLFFRAECHDLAFHLGSPIDTFLEWENLDIWAGRPGPNYIVMPLDCAAEWSEHVTAGRLVEVLRNTDLPGAAEHEHPLVLMCTRPNAATATP